MGSRFDGHAQGSPGPGAGDAGGIDAAPVESVDGEPDHSRGCPSSGASPGSGGADELCGEEGGADQDQFGWTAPGSAGSAWRDTGSGVTDADGVGVAGSGRVGCAGTYGVGTGSTAGDVAWADDEDVPGVEAYDAGPTLSLPADPVACGAVVSSVGVPAGDCVLTGDGAVNEVPSGDGTGVPQPSWLGQSKATLVEESGAGEVASDAGAPTMTMATASGIAPGRPRRENRCTAPESINSCLVLIPSKNRPRRGSRTIVPFARARMERRDNFLWKSFS